MEEERGARENIRKMRSRMRKSTHSPKMVAWNLERCALALKMAKSSMGPYVSFYLVYLTLKTIITMR